MSRFKKDGDAYRCLECDEIVIDIYLHDCPKDDDGERTYNKRLEEGFGMMEMEDENEIN